MPACSLCESEVPEGWRTCGACGHPVGGPLTARSSAEAARRALESTRKALAGEPAGPIDLSFPRRLIERAEQTDAAGDLGRALDLGRVVYSFHNAKTERFVARRLAAAGARVTDRLEFAFPIRHMFRFHRREAESVPVVLFRVEAAKG